MGEPDDVRALLTTAAESRQVSLHDPAGRVLHRIRVRRRRRQAVALAGVAVAMVLALGAPAVVVREHLRRPDPLRSASTPTTAKSVAELSRGRWSVLPEAPVPARSNAAAAWTGEQFLVWGGVTYDTLTKPGTWLPVLHADGAAYDPSSKRWEKLPPAPLSPRIRPASAWTGSEWLLWGSDDGEWDPSWEKTHRFFDGAAYNPRTRTWRKLPAAPLGENIDGRAVWTGQEMVVLSRSQPDQIAAYNPRTNRWRKLAPLPLEAGRVLDFTTLVSAGDRLYVWAHWFSDVGPDNIATKYGTKVLEYDASSGRRVPPTFHGEVPKDVTGWAWTGSELVVMSSGGYAPPGVDGGEPRPLAGYRLDPASGTWRRTADGPPEHASLFTAWAGDAALSLVGEWIPRNAEHGRLAAWDSVADRWVRLARAPYTFGDGDAVTVWTGRELLIWGLLFPSNFQGDDWQQARASVGMRLGP